MAILDTVEADTAMVDTVAVDTAMVVVTAEADTAMVVVTVDMAMVRMDTADMDMEDITTTTITIMDRTPRLERYAETRARKCWIVLLLLLDLTHPSLTLFRTNRAA